MNGPTEFDLNLVEDKEKVIDPSIIMIPYPYPFQWIQSQIQMMMKIYDKKIIY